MGHRWRRGARSTFEFGGERGEAACGSLKARASWERARGEVRMGAVSPCPAPVAGRGCCHTGVGRPCRAPGDGGVPPTFSAQAWARVAGLWGVLRGCPALGHLTAVPCVPRARTRSSPARGLSERLSLARLPPRSRSPPQARWPGSGEAGLSRRPWSAARVAAALLSPVWPRLSGSGSRAVGKGRGLLWDEGGDGDKASATGKRISLLAFLEGQQPRSWQRAATLISFKQKK